MSTSEDTRVFEAISSHFIAPIFFYLSFVMGCFTIFVVWNAFANPHNLPLGGVAFLLSYNAFIAGKKLKGNWSQSHS